MARYSASTLATAHFLKDNPGATAREIHEHLGSVLDLGPRHRKWTVGSGRDGKSSESLEGTFNHITSHYFSHHLGEEGFIKRYTPDWIRSKCPVKKVYIYHLTDHGKRLLPLSPSKAGYPYKVQA